MAGVGMWEATTSAPITQDSPLGPVVNGMQIDDTGTKRRQAVFNGGPVPEDAPNAEALNAIASDDKDEKALRQANVTVRELYRAAGQLKVHLRARKARLVDGRYAVSFWRASQPSTRGRKAGSNGAENREE